MEAHSEAVWDAIGASRAYCAPYNAGKPSEYNTTGGQTDEQKREYNKVYDRTRRRKKVCACGNQMTARSKQCRACANKNMRRWGNQ